MGSNLNLMLDFCIGLLNAAADFLGSEPIIYFVGGFFGLVVVKIIKSLIHI